MCQVHLVYTAVEIVSGTEAEPPFLQFLKIALEVEGSISFCVILTNNTKDSKLV